MKKLAILATAITALSISIHPFAMETADFYKELADSNGIGIVQEYWTDELDGETILNRGDSILIEKLIGVCLDDEGNGKLLNPYAEGFTELSYSSVDGVSKGDVVLTIFIYAPGDGEDDIVDRFDFVIDQQ